jgi:hypothetical protein
MIEYENGVVMMSLVDVEHCGFGVGEFHAELEMAGIANEAARRPVALLVNFVGGAVVTPATSAETRTQMEEANRQFQSIMSRVAQTGRCYVVSRRVSYVFRVDGEYCERLKGLPDPADEDWEYFDMHDLHPGGADHITILTDYAETCPEAQAAAVSKAVTVVEWMQEEKGWEGFDATLWLCHRDKSPDARAFRWVG